MFDQGPFFLVYTRAADNPPPSAFAHGPGQGGSQKEPSTEIQVGTTETDVPTNVGTTRPALPRIQADEPARDSAPTEDLLGLDIVADDPTTVEKPEEAVYRVDSSCEFN